MPYGVIRSQRYYAQPIVIWKHNRVLKINVSSHYLNSLTPGKFEWNFRPVIIFKEILMIDGWGISCEIALIWMSLDFTDDQSTLVQAMAWCHQATSHYLSRCWPRSLLPYGITRPQWVNQCWFNILYNLKKKKKTFSIWRLSFTVLA